MGVQTLADFRSRLQLMLGNRGFENSDLDYWINTGVEDLASRYIWQELQSPFTGGINPGTNILLPITPDNIYGYLTLKNESDDKPMIKVGQQKWNRLNSENESGKPKYWIREGDQVLVWPSNNTDSVVLVSGSCIREHPLLVLDIDTTLFGRRWDRAVQYLAAVHALNDLEETSRSEVYANIVGRYIDRNRRMVAEIESAAVGEPVQVILDPYEFEKLEG